ncbi:GspH/FimT family pseudopilin [Biformimicrobium ophioploci]|uniref:Type II secretion system protein H n=1 Tax=Biformimicrobium ophioploci TaxID=3036711 RepID=A0ABQ6M2K7_9GAMM|nr:GspH/FimT family pseudopilin [Microbulbifer sp. NKW57]GMG88575.1 hypothetical protein MNKW57_28960 [Microbulbifer sp. NKW57]
MNIYRGYTLIEMMLVIACLAIIASVAIPSFSELLEARRNRLSGYALFDLIATARGLSLSQQKNLVICPAHNNRCGSNWAGGALLFEDSNRNGALDDGESLLRQIDAFRSGTKLSWASFGNRPYLRYRPDGVTPSQSGSFHYCPPSGKNTDGWIIILNATGRAYFGRDNNGNGIVENGSGVDLDCNEK